MFVGVEMQPNMSCPFKITQARTDRISAEMPYRIPFTIIIFKQIKYFLYVCIAFVNKETCMRKKC
jgi:hypothetical protein